jgi:hypothetical protein
MAKYIDSDNFRSEYIKSRSQGFKTKEFDLILLDMVEKMWRKYSYYSTYFEDRHIYIWNIQRRLNTLWLGYNPELNKNPLPYFAEVIKRILASTYNRIDRIKKEYFYYEIVQKRKEKLKTLNELYN